MYSTINEPNGCDGLVWVGVNQGQKVVNLFSCFVLSALILYVPVNNFSAMSGWVFLSWTSTEQRIKSLTEGYNAVPSVRLNSCAWVKHSITEPLRSLMLTTEDDFFTCSLMLQRQQLLAFLHLLAEKMWLVFSVENSNSSLFEWFINFNTLHYITTRGASCDNMLQVILLSFN